MKRVNLWSVSIVGILMWCAGPGRCAESIRALPGFQPFTSDRPHVLLPNDGSTEAVRQAYDEAKKDRVCLYARVVDQDGAAVANAMVKVWTTNQAFWGGWGNPLRTTTDADGRFSVVGGRTTRLQVRIIKPGYTPMQRNGLVRSGDPETLRATLDQPAVIQAWKNTGFDRTRLITYRPMTFVENRHDQFRPMVHESFNLTGIDQILPRFVRFDLVKGVRVLDESSSEWDVQVSYAVDERGRLPKELQGSADGVHARGVTLLINQGKLVYVSDPPSGFERIGERYWQHDVPGVVTRALHVDHHLYRYGGRENRMFLFSSRGGAVHGVCTITNAHVTVDGTANPSVYCIVNPTGSPALNEREPTAEDLNVDGFLLAE